MRRKTNPPVEESEDALWQRRAMTAGVLAVRRAFEEGGVAPETPVSRLTDIELGWLVASAVFAWIRSRSEQATANGWATEEALRITSHEPQGWDVGAVTYALPQIGQLPGLDWTKPLSAWSKDEIAWFLLEATKLVRAAAIARDVGGGVSSPGSLDEATAPSASSGSPTSPAGETPASEALRAPGNGECPF